MRLRFTPRVGLTVGLAISLAACFGAGENDRAETPSPSPEPPPPIEAAPPAIMFAGADSVQGTRAVYCENSRCAEPPDPDLPRTLRLPESGFVSFVLPSEPNQVRIEVWRDDRHEGAPFVARALTPGTLIPYSVELPAGRYRLALAASWETNSARWLFRLDVPDQ